MNEFSILPWEYRGSGASTTASAWAEASIGGHKRQFSLRMREGVIYFREPKGASIWAVTRQFERDLAGDELINAWRDELKRENYGRYLLYTPYLFGGRLGNKARSGTETALGLVHRADYSGWAREWFDDQWRDIPAHRDGRALDVWGKSWSDASKRAYAHVQTDLVERALPASVRRDIPTRWVSGDEAELRRIFGLALALFVRSLDDRRVVGSCVLAASNPISAGGWKWMVSPAYRHDLRFASAWKPLTELIQQKFVLVGMMWQRREAQPSARNADYVKLQRARFGDDWRGDWRVQTPEVTLPIQLVARISAHEKLEATLQLRDWLNGKVSPQKSKNWLSKALD